MGNTVLDSTRLDHKRTRDKFTGHNTIKTGCSIDLFTFKPASSDTVIVLLGLILPWVTHGLHARCYF